MGVRGSSLISELCDRDHVTSNPRQGRLSGARPRSGLYPFHMLTAGEPEIVVWQTYNLISGWYCQIAFRLKWTLEQSIKDTHHHPASAFLTTFTPQAVALHELFPWLEHLSSLLFTWLNFKAQLNN